MDKTIAEFDKAAGLTTQHDKTEFAVTDEKQKKALKKMKIKTRNIIRGLIRDVP